MNTLIEDEAAVAAKRAEQAGYANMHGGHYEVITSDLHALPMVIVSAGTVDTMCEQLGMWSFAGPLSGESVGKVREYVYQAQPPSDGLLGTCITEQFTLPELSGMRIHVQIS